MDNGWWLPIYREGYTDPYYQNPARSMMLQPFSPPGQWPMMAPPPPPPPTPAFPHPYQMMQQMNDSMRDMQQSMSSMLFPYFPPGQFRPDVAPSQLAPVEDDQTYKIEIQAPEYKPNEITVKTVEREGRKFVIAEGKHETRDSGGYHSVHHFRRQYMVPDNVRPETFTSKLSGDGTLSIQAPKVANQPAIKQAEGGGKHIPIQQQPGGK